MYGREYIGVDRSTFLVSSDGKVIREWRNVKVKDHVDEVFNSVKDLTYIQDLLKDFPEAEKVAEVNKNYFQKAVDQGHGENFISELINKK